jgi:histidinol-phosphate/aromatic aminotransferase/cobyric acid decarboxylase-like protein
MDKKTGYRQPPSALRRELLEVGQVTHGGRQSEGMIDFSVCLNPWPLPLQVRRAIEEAPLGRYPDSGGEALKQALAASHSCITGEIVLCNGISQGIFLSAFALLERGDKTLIVGPTYGEYEKNCRLMGADIHHFTCRPEEGFRPSLQRLEETIETISPQVVWLCNPDNPTGVLLGSGEVEEIRRLCLRRGAFLIMDEAYMNFVDQEKKFTGRGENVLVLRSMTKDFSIPGLRLGYIKGPKRIISAIAAAQPEWSLNAPALAAGEAAMKALADFRSQWQIVREETLELAGELEKLDFTVYPPAANFILVRDNSGDPGLEEELQRQGMMLRNCASFGLPGFYRIGTSLREHNRALLSALKRRR